MTIKSSKDNPTFKSVEAMYNAHPFPQRSQKLERRSDERFEYIYKHFLHIPFEELENKVFLDAGCGTGENTWSWTRILPQSTRIIAVDLSQASVRIASSSAAGQSKTPNFHVGSLMDLGIASESVDVVFCSGVLVAIPDPYQAYRELVRILKPGGYMILVLYHQYGRMLHGMKRAVVDVLEPKDVDRRVRLGDQLFGRSMRKMANDEQVPYEGVLYDQFGLLCESRYSVGDALKWFQKSGIEYRGTWPPVEWSQLGKGLRFSYHFNQGKMSPIKRLLMKFFPDTNEAPHKKPGWLTRASMQTLWGFNQLQLFAISGQKAMKK